MSESKIERLVPRWRRGRRPWFLGGVLCVLLVVALALGYFYYDRHLAEQRLAEAIAEVDRVDPRWRLKEIEVDRVTLPDDVNGALRVRAARKALPKEWSLPPVEKPWEALSRQERLPARTEAVYREERAKYPASLGLARQVADFDRGRFPINVRPYVLDTGLPHHDAVDRVREFLALDAVLLAHDGESSDALRCCRAILNVGRSIGDEPLAISQLRRMASSRHAVRLAERALAQGSSAVSELNELQVLVHKEDQENWLYVMLRGERAMYHEVGIGLEAGAYLLTPDLDRLTRPTWKQRLHGEWDGSRLRRSHARLLDEMTKVVETAKLQPHERAGPILELETNLRADWAQFRDWFIVLNIVKVGVATQRYHAHLRSLEVALASERYRLKHGSWPNSPDRLCPAFLAAVPLDPYDGGRIRFRWRDGGIVVYCVGSDGIDNLGRLEPWWPSTAEKRALTTEETEDTDVGVQLWGLPR